jgi:Holliday junction resolvase
MAGKVDGDGKVAEGKFTAHMKERMKLPEWWFHRFPDAAVCMGRIPKQPADYIIMHNGRPMLVEVKESKSETSVAKSRFTQAPKMTRFNMAGGRCGFLVYFRYAVEPYWVFVPLDVAKAAEKSVKITREYSKYSDISDLVDYIKDNEL